MAPELSLTIPIYNEEKGINETVINLSKELEKNDIDYEIILINHGSEDNTEKVLKKLSSKNKRLRVINLQKNLGYGGGIQYGFEHSNGEFIGWTCADEEVNAQDVVKVYTELKKSGYQLAKAIRTERKDGLIRKMTSLIFNGIVLLRYQIKVRDLNGYPLFMKRELFPRVKAKETAYLFNLDLIRNIRKTNNPILGVPVIHQIRKKGRSFMNLKRIANMALKLLNYSLNYPFDKHTKPHTS